MKKELTLRQQESRVKKLLIEMQELYDFIFFLHKEVFNNMEGSYLTSLLIHIENSEPINSQIIMDIKNILALYMNKYGFKEEQIITTEQDQNIFIQLTNF